MRCRRSSFFALALFAASSFSLAAAEAPYTGPEEATIAQIHAAFLAKKLTARQLVAAYAARIEAYDQKGPMLNSIITVNPQALAEADKLDAALKSTGKLTGPLHGIPFVVKDNIDTGDLATSGGAAAFRDFHPERDGTSVKNPRRRRHPPRESVACRERHRSNPP